MVLPNYRKQTTTNLLEPKYHETDFPPPLVVPECWGPSVVTVPARINVVFFKHS